MRILLVDDDRLLRRAIPRLLRGLEIAVVQDAGEALAALATEPYDVIVTDHAMPSYNGLQLLLDVAGAHSNMRRILMTGIPPRFFDDHLASRLVHAVLTKPFNRSDLLRAIGVPSIAPRPRLECAG